MMNQHAEDNTEAAGETTLIRVKMVNGALEARCSACESEVEIYPWTIRAHHNSHIAVAGQGVLW